MFSSLIVGGFVAQKSTVSISEAMGRWAIALQGGAGDISTSMTEEKKKVAEEALHECLDIGVSALENSASALDVVEKVVSACSVLFVSEALNVELTKPHSQGF
jgi:hypothetical protein